MSLKKQAIGGVKWTAVAATFTALLQLIQIAILARFLSKQDFGIMALSLFIIGISQIFIDMGISNSIIHKQNVNKFQLSTLFYLNIVIGIFVYLLIFILAPAIAVFYKTPELVHILRSIGITFLIIPFGQLYETLLRKDLNFKSLSIRDVIGKIVGFLVSVVLAFMHFGVYSLVYANLVAACVSTFLLVYFGYSSFRPMLKFSFKSLNGKGFFSFGLFQMGEQFVNYLNSQFDTLLIGKLLGMEALGVYNIAITLAYRPYKIINPIITKVAFPVLSKLQHDIDKLRAAYIKIVNSLALINAPIYVMFIIFARPIISFFFGNEWLAAAPMLQILSIGTLLNSVNNPVGSLQLAKGRADLGFYWNIGMLIIIPTALYIGYYFGGIFGVVYSFTIVRILLQIPAWFYFIRPLCKVSFSEYFLSFLKPFVIAALAGIVCYGSVFFIENATVQMLLGVVVYMLVFALLVYFKYKELVGWFLSNIKKGKS